MNNTKEQELLLEEENLELSSATGTGSDADILFEDTSKRSENTKHFRLKNGHYVAAVYNKPIHFLDEESGDFKDLSDRFQEKEDCFEADTGRFKARFPKKEGKAKFVSVEKEGRTVSWRYLPKNAKRKNPEAAVSRKGKRRPMDIPEFPCLKYGKEDTQTDLEYSISELGVKENIILSKCPKDPTFRFELKTEGVKAVLAEDKKSVSLVADNDASGVPTFTIPPITMLDASGITSEDAHYELAEENGMTVLSVCIDPAWLTAPERVFPVTVDPQISVSDYENCSVSTFLTVRSDGNVFNTKTPKVGVGIDMFDYENNLYAQMDFSSIPHGAIINRARLGLFQADYLGNDSYNVYRVTSPWTPENISWANQPRHDSTALDSITAQLRGDGQVVFLDVTEVARNAFYGTAPNYGIVMKRDFGAFCSCQSSCTADCNCPCNCRGYMIFYTKLYDNGNYEPLIYVEYTLPDDYVDHAEYTTFEAGLAGVAGINLHTGQLTYQYNEVSFSGGRLPLSFSHIFQSSEAENNPNTFYGRGWFPAQLQTLHPYDYGNYCAVYRDGQGKKHYFRDDFVVNIGTPEAQNHWLGDSDGVGLICNPIITEIRDEKDNVMTFENGNLKTLSDAYSNTMTFDYDNLQRLKKITDSLGRTVDLTYTSNRLFYLKDSENRSYRFTYDGIGNLVKILHPHTYTETAPNAPSTSFAYDIKNRLVMITDTRGLCHEIGYDELGRVTSVRKTGTKKLENGNLIDVTPFDGGGMNITYYDNSTVVEDVKTGLRTVYRFDDCGHTTLTYEDVTNCGSVSPEPVTAMQLFEYENLYHNGLSNSAKQDETMKSSGCYATLQADTMGPDEMHPNYLKNHKFTDSAGTVDPDKWIVSLPTVTSCCNGCSASVPVGGSVVEDGFLGQYEDYADYKAYKLDSTVYSGSKTLHQELSMSDITIDGNVLIASLWVKAENVLPSQFNFFVKVTFKNGSPMVVKTITLERGVTGWQYLAMPIEIPEGDSPDLVRFTVKLANGNGSCIIFNPSLTETCGTFTNINYLETPIDTQYFSEKALMDFETIPVCREITVRDNQKKVVECYDAKNDKVIVHLHRFGEVYTSYFLYDDKHQLTESENYDELMTTLEYTPKGFQKLTHIRLLDPASDDYGDCRIYNEHDINWDTGLANSETDSTGKITEYLYDSLSRVEQVFCGGYSCRYEYNAGNDLVKKVYDNHLQNTFNNFNYHPSEHYLQSISQNNYEYTFDYDCFGAVCKTSAADVMLENCSTSTTDPCIVTTVYAVDAAGNKTTGKVHYNAHGDPIKKELNNVTISTATYDSRGNVREVLDSTRNLCYTYTYNKDGTIQEISAEKSDVGYSATKTFTYDPQTHRLEKTKDFATDLEYRPIYKNIEKIINGETETIRTDPSDSVVGVELIGKFTDKTDSDPLGHPRKRTLTLASEEEPFLTDTYKYNTYQYSRGETISELFIVGEQKQEYRVIENGETTKRTATWHYTYDAEFDEDSENMLSNSGNIKEIITPDGFDIKYEYDHLNRLTLETRNGDPYRIEYDDFGNIKTKQTPESLPYTFTYGEHNGWKDQLTAINGESVSYDECRNPISYRNYRMEWSNARQLTWCNVLDKSGNGTVHTFAYGADGIRCRKNNIHYTCDGERILIEHNADTGRSITYLYGEKGVVGFSYRGSDYYYRKNLFGDVVAIYNTSGTKVATYKYDAWGKNLSCEDEETNEIKHVNPFRYRSYYYDVETGFYYLNSRYYDPEIGRFLNADSSDYLGEGNALNNYNLFAYCENNPVMYSDPTGHAIETIWDVISLLDSLKQVLAMPSNPWARAELLGDVIDVALPGIGGLGESVGAARTICRVVDSGDDIIDSARTLRRMADKADDIKDATGSYVILYESGQHYIGKGGFLRATISAKNHLLKTDKVSAIIWAPVSSEKSAFVLEYLMQSTLNSKQKINKFAFNKYWSPGKKMLKALQL